jgi:hypothetical protein
MSDKKNALLLLGHFFILCLFFLILILQY